MPSLPSLYNLMSGTNCMKSLEASISKFNFALLTHIENNKHIPIPPKAQGMKKFQHEAFTDTYQDPF